MFTNIYKSKSIRLEFYIKALENKILSFKTQLHHLCFLLLECSKDSINENSIDMEKINENSNNNNNVVVDAETKKQSQSSNLGSILNEAYSFIQAKFQHYLVPINGTPDEKGAFIINR